MENQEERFVAFLLCTGAGLLTSGIKTEDKGDKEKVPIAREILTDQGR